MKCFYFESECLAVSGEVGEQEAQMTAFAIRGACEENNIKLNKWIISELKKSKWIISEWMKKHTAFALDGAARQGRKTNSKKIEKQTQNNNKRI